MLASEMYIIQEKTQHTRITYKFWETHTRTSKIHPLHLSPKTDVDFKETFFHIKTTNLIMSRHNYVSLPYILFQYHPPREVFNIFNMEENTYFWTKMGENVFLDKVWHLKNKL